MKRISVARILVALLLVSPAIARADDAPPFDPDAHLRLEGDVGFAIGGVSVGPFSGLAVGFQVAGGVRLDRLALLGVYDRLGLSSDLDQTGLDTTTTGATLASSNGSPPSQLSDADLSGLEQRIGIAARYSVGKISDPMTGLRADFWLEGGLGRQYITWDQGGELQRNDVEFGVGGDFAFRWGDRDHQHRLGMRFSMMATFARPPGIQVTSPPTCAGPCDEPTSPGSSLDSAWIFDIAMLFGN